MMTELGQKLYVKGQMTIDKLKDDERGSTAVEFMGIAAVVVIIIVIISKWLNDNGETQIGGIFDGLFSGISKFVTEAFK